MPAPTELLITKASGAQVPFDEAKLRASLERSGATPELCDAVLEALRGKVVEGMSTRKLYRLAFDLLHRRARPVAARYRLKRAILALGPSGFPFERFIARILEHDGYAAQVGVVVQGRCVPHEVDVVADKAEQHFLVECKYHNTPGRVCDVKVPLYIKARFDDVADRWRAEPGNGHRFHQGWVVTNTRFTRDALEYGLCAGLRMVGWDQPAKGSLRDRIDRSGLYPLTCLASLTRVEKQRLLDAGLVLARDIAAEAGVLEKMQVRPPRVNAVLREVAAVCERGR